MLMVRQKLYNANDGKGINLSDIELIDSGAMDKMLADQKSQK